MTRPEVTIGLMPSSMHVPLHKDKNSQLAKATLHDKVLKNVPSPARLSNLPAKSLQIPRLHSMVCFKGCGLIVEDCAQPSYSYRGGVGWAFIKYSSSRAYLLEAIITRAQ